MFSIAKLKYNDFFSKVCEIISMLCVKFDSEALFISAQHVLEFKNSVLYIVIKVLIKPTSTKHLFFVLTCSFISFMTCIACQNEHFVKY